MRLKLILSRQNRFSLSARLEKASLKTLTKRVVNRTDPFYFIDIIVIENYDLVAGKLRTKGFIAWNQRGTCTSITSF